MEGWISIKSSRHWLFSLVELFKSIETDVHGSSLCACVNCVRRWDVTCQGLWTKPSPSYYTTPGCQVLVSPFSTLFASTYGWICVSVLLDFSVAPALFLVGYWNFSALGNLLLLLWKAFSVFCWWCSYSASPQRTHSIAHVLVAIFYYGIASTSLGFWKFEGDRLG